MDKNHESAYGLKAAAALCLDAEVAALSRLDVDGVTVSRRTVARVLRAARAATAPLARRVGKAAACFLVALSLLFASLLCIEPIRAEVIRAVLTWYEEYVRVRIFAPDEEFPTKNIEIILPDVPAEWEVTEVSCDDYLVLYLYHAPQGQRVSYNQIPWNDSTVSNYDNTDCTVQEIDLSGRHIAQLLSYADGRFALIWENRYVFSLFSTDIDLDTLLAMAESVNDKVAKISAKN